MARFIFYREVNKCMESFKNFCESTGKKLIIVDVQPTYAKNINWMKDFNKFVEPYGEILCLYNGPDLGFENKGDIARFYMKYGMKRETVTRMKWFEKNYAFFREFMDRCWLREDIIKIIRYMLRTKTWDIRNLSEEDIRKIGVSDLVHSELEKYGFYIPELAFIIRKWAGADICGGGLEECLEEVMLLGDSLKLNFNVIRQFTF